MVKAALMVLCQRYPHTELFETAMTQSKTDESYRATLLNPLLALAIWAGVSALLRGMPRNIDSTN